MRGLRLFLLAGAGALLVATGAMAATPIRVDMPFSLTIRVLDEQAGKYAVEIDNGNPTRVITGFKWTPPAGMNVTEVTRTIGGKCELSGEIILCKGGGAIPPSTAESIGSGLLVYFTASGRQPTWTGKMWIHYGVVGAVEVQTSKFSDLPLCKKGVTSTKTHPCEKPTI